MSTARTPAKSSPKSRAGAAAARRGTRASPASGDSAPAREATRKATRKAAADAAPVAARSGIDLSVLGLAREVRQWADAVLGLAKMAGSGAGLALTAAQPLIGGPAGSKSLRRTGAALKDLREAAGLSLRELGDAIGMGDPETLESIESGRAAIPFEIILRLAAVLGRNDPLPFILNLARQSNPRIAKALEDLGVGRLIIHAGREREFVNLYRAQDELREMSDEEFAALLHFVGGAVKLVVAQRRAAGKRPT